MWVIVLTSLATLAAFIPTDSLRLGQTNIILPETGKKSALGTWSWGNRLLYGYSNERDDAIIATYLEARRNGICMFDTGDSYGTGGLQGNAERLLREGEERFKIVEDFYSAPPAIFIAKIAVYPWLLSADSYYQKILQSRERLGFGEGEADNANHFIPSMHWSPRNYAPWQVKPILEGLATAFEEGLCSGIGVSNLGPNELLICADFFQKRDVPIAANQIQCSLVSNFEADVEGALAVGLDIGVDTLGYSCLGLGVLGGNRPGGLRGSFFEALQGDPGGKILLEEVRKIGEENGVPTTVVAIAWVRKRGLIPLFGARGVTQLKENIADFDFVLGIDAEERLEKCRKKLTKMAVRNAFMTQ